MAQFVVAKSVAFAFPDTSVRWDIEKDTNPGTWRVVHDGLELTQGSGVYEITLELLHTSTPDALVSVDGTLLTMRDSTSKSHGDGNETAWAKFATKIRSGSMVSVWAKNNEQGVARGAGLTICKLPDDS